MNYWVDINNKPRCSMSCTCCHPHEDMRLGAQMKWGGVQFSVDMPEEIKHCVFESVRTSPGHWHYRAGLRNPKTGETKNVRDFFFKIVTGKWGEPEVTQWWEIEP